MRKNLSIDDRAATMDQAIDFVRVDLHINNNDSGFGFLLPLDPARQHQSRLFSLNCLSLTSQQELGTGWRRASRCRRKENV